ncbi:MAG: hypothetical protein K0R38_4172 [Polyangiaceae bacterium]|nr:hypothetical protein [Polyangiaceae bacterium]
MSPVVSIRWSKRQWGALLVMVNVAACVSRSADAPTRHLEAAPVERPLRFEPSVLEAADFGADGADEQDDTAAIQSAVTAAQAIPGARVQLAAGVFYLSDVNPHDQVCLGIVGARGLTLQGAGAGSTRLVLRSKPDAHVLSIAGSESVRVSDLSIDGTRMGRRGTHGIRVADSTGITLRSLEIHSVAHYGIGLQRGVVRGISIEGVQIDDTGGDGVDFKNTAAQNDEIVIEDVRVSRPGQTSPRQAGLDIRGRARLSNVEVSHVPAGATGIRFREDGPDTGPGGHGSYLSGFAVTGAPGSIGVAIAANDVRVSDGSVVGTDTGVDILGDRARVSSVLVRGARYAFRIEVAAQQTFLQGCRGESSRAGVWVEGKSTQISRSIFQRNERCGVCLRPGSLGTHLADNELAGNGKTVEDDAGNAGE